MMLITAALAEELKVALDLCPSATKFRFGNDILWEARCEAGRFYFFKTGAGPSRAGDRLGRLLTFLKPSRILVLGYAGALAPDLRLGELAVIERAVAVEQGSEDGALENFRVTGTWDLAVDDDLCRHAGAAGPVVHRCDILTSPYIIGDPGHKALLHGKFGARAVDMETAALACAAAASGFRISCIRAVSDEAGDDFLAPFSYQPAGPLSRTVKLARPWKLLGSHDKWKENSAAARRSLARFLERYLGRQAGKEAPSAKA